MAVVNDPEGPEAGDLFCEVLAQGITFILDFAVAFFAEAQEVVILADNFSTGAGKVERERGHVAAEVIHVEDQFLGKVVLFAPKRPADAQRGQTKLMAGGIDGFHAGQAEVPEEVRLGEGRQKSAAGPIDVDGDVEPRLGMQLVEGDADLVYRLELEGEGDAEGDDDADGVFVAALDDLFRGEQKRSPFHGDFADFDVEVAAEFVPADLDGPMMRFGASVGLPLARAALPPVPLEGQAAEHGRLAGAGGGAADGAGSLR